MFAAPYCTVAYIYKVVERFFRFKNKDWWFLKDKTRCLIFGYNDEVKALLNGYNKNNYRIHLVAENISEDEELELLRDGINVHKVDLHKENKDMDYFVSYIIF